MAAGILIPTCMYHTYMQHIKHTYTCTYKHIYTQTDTQRHIH